MGVEVFWPLFVGVTGFELLDLLFLSSNDSKGLRSFFRELQELEGEGFTGFTGFTELTGFAGFIGFTGFTGFAGFTEFAGFTGLIRFPPMIAFLLILACILALLGLFDELSFTFTSLVSLFFSFCILGKVVLCRSGDSSSDLSLDLNLIFFNNALDLSWLICYIY